MVRDGRTLDEAARTLIDARLDGGERATARELAWGTARWYPRLSALADRLFDRPPRARDLDLRLLVCLGLYQLDYMRTPDHAAVSATVAEVARLGKPRARGMVNAVLRRYLREGETLRQQLAEQSPAASHALPEWLYHRLQQAWPEAATALIEAGNQRPPMVLRASRLHGGRARLLERLEVANIPARALPHADDAVRVDPPCSVERLPGFAEGACSVQDGAAQLSARLLAPQPGERLLDACAAPGGKSTHLLECCPDCRLTALDIDPQRLQRVADNLQRCKLQAELIAADITAPPDWWDGTPFDRILLDAPCSATGVLRRHPDIRLLRRASDLPPLVTAQRQALARLWPMLRRGGTLVYSTCSVLPEENAETIAAFLEHHPDARVSPIDADWGRPAGAGRQILTGEDGMDGFYHARLVKA